MLKQLFFGGMAQRFQFYLRAMAWAKRSGHRRLANLISRRLERRHGLFIAADAKIASTCRFPHPTGIVIGVGVSIGERVVVYQNVTMGAVRRESGRSKRYPRIGNDCIIFAGAVLVGDIELGDGCVVGANAVVTRSFPPKSTIVGVPGAPASSRKHNDG